MVKKVISLQFMIWLLLTHIVTAAGFDADAYNNRNNSEGNLLDGLLFEMDSLLPAVYKIGLIIFTGIFIAGIIGMTLATILRNGQWTKWSTNAMFLSYIVLIILKVVPILLLTNSITEITHIASDSIVLMQEIAVYLSIFVVLLGFVLKGAFKVLKHPDYYRWARNLFIGGMMMYALSIIAPFIFRFT